MFEKGETDNKPLLTLRNARDVIVICLIGVVTWKLISSDFNISIEEFTFTELLSTIVSFFAIALSIAFYFKATETSNRFYDNSYTFTKEMSEILGRIESGFGEKLKHIDEGYTGIRDRIDQLPFDFNKAKKDVESEKVEIENKKKEQNEILESLANKAKLVETEKNELFQRMEKTSREIESAEDDLRRLQRNILEHENQNTHPISNRRAMNYVAKIVSEKIPPDSNWPLHSIMVKEIFENMRSEFSGDLRRDLFHTGIIDKSGRLTKNGLDVLHRKVSIFYDK